MDDGIGSSELIEVRAKHLLIKKKQSLNPNPAKI